MLRRVVGLDITVSRLRPIKGSSHIPLPNGLMRNKGLINMQNKDQQSVAKSNVLLVLLSRTYEISNNDFLRI